MSQIGGGGSYPYNDAINVSGIATITAVGTWISSNPGVPISYQNQLRGGLQWVDGVNFKLTDISSKRIDVGMIVYLQNQYTAGATTRNPGYYIFNFTAGQTRSLTQGTLVPAPTEANWTPVSIIQDASPAGQALLSNAGGGPYWGTASGGGSVTGNTLSNIQSSNITQPFANLAVSNSVTTTNIISPGITSVYGPVTISGKPVITAVNTLTGLTAMDRLNCSEPYFVNASASSAFSLYKRVVYTNFFAQTVMWSGCPNPTTGKYYTFDSDGNLYTTDENGFLIGSSTQWFTPGSNPTTTLRYYNGLLFACDSAGDQQVFYINAPDNPMVTSGALSGVFTIPVDLFIDKSGKIFVADAGAFGVWIFQSYLDTSPTFVPITFPSGAIYGPFCICGDSLGYLYVTLGSLYPNSLVAIKIDQTGTILATYASPNPGPSTNFVYGIAVDNFFNVYIGDSPGSATFGQIHKFLNDGTHVAFITSDTASLYTIIYDPSSDKLIYFWADGFDILFTESQIYGKGNTSYIGITGTSLDLSGSDASRPTLKVTGNVYSSNSLTTTNLVSTSLVVTGAMTSNVTNTTLFYDTLTIPYVNTLQLTAPSIISTGGISRFSNLIVSNLQVTNTQTTNSLSVINQGTTTALYVNQNKFPNMTYNVAEFWDHTQLAMVIDGYGNVAVHTASSPGYAFTVVDGAKIDKLTVTGSLIGSGAALSSLNASNLFGAANLTTLNVSTLAATTANITTLNVTGAVTFSNVSGNGAGLTSLNASNITTGILSSARIYGNTLGNISGSNVTTGINASNITTGILSSVRIYGNTLSNIQSSNITQPLANLVVSNTVTTSEIICNAFTTSTATNWNYISNAASARSTSVGWQGIRQVFGDHITSNVYVYNNAVLETTLSYIASGFGAFVAVGGVNDAIIVVSGVDAFYIYYFDGLIWNGPNAVNTTPYLGTNNTLWMPSLSVVDTSIKLVIGGYGWVSAAGGGNPGVGVYNIRLSDGSAGFFGEITPYNSVGTLNRNTVAISGDGTTIAIGQQDSSILYVYSITDLLTPVFYDSTDPGDEYYVSIDYYGQIILLTLNGSVRMYSISLTPV